MGKVRIRRPTPSYHGRGGGAMPSNGLLKVETQNLADEARRGDPCGLSTGTIIGKIDIGCFAIGRNWRRRGHPSRNVRIYLPFPL